MKNDEEKRLLALEIKHPMPSIETIEKIVGHSLSKEDKEYVERKRNTNHTLDIQTK